MSIGRCAMQPAVAGSDASLRVGRIGDATRPDKSPANSKDQKGGLQSPTNASFLNGFRVIKWFKWFFIVFKWFSTLQSSEVFE